MIASKWKKPCRNDSLIPTIFMTCFSTSQLSGSLFKPVGFPGSPRHTKNSSQKAEVFVKSYLWWGSNKIPLNYQRKGRTAQGAQGITTYVSAPFFVHLDVFLLQKSSTEGPPMRTTPFLVLKKRGKNPQQKTLPTSKNLCKTWPPKKDFFGK